MKNARYQSIVYLKRLVKTISSLFTVLDRNSDEINFKAQLFTLFVPRLIKYPVYHRYVSHEVSD